MSVCLNVCLSVCFSVHPLFICLVVFYLSGCKLTASDAVLTAVLQYRGGSTPAARTDRSIRCAMPTFNRDGPSRPVIAAAALALFKKLPDALPVARLALVATEFSDLPGSGGTSAVLCRFLASANHGSNSKQTFAADDDVLAQSASASVAGSGEGPMQMTQGPLAADRKASSSRSTKAVHGPAALMSRFLTSGSRNTGSAVSSTTQQTRGDAQLTPSAMLAAGTPAATAMEHWKGHNQHDPHGGAVAQALVHQDQSDPQDQAGSSRELQAAIADTSTTALAPPPQHSTQLDNAQTHMLDVQLSAYAPTAGLDAPGAAMPPPGTATDNGLAGDCLHNARHSDQLRGRDSPHTVGASRQVDDQPGVDLADISIADQARILHDIQIQAMVDRRRSQQAASAVPGHDNSNAMHQQHTAVAAIPGVVDACLPGTAKSGHPGLAATNGNSTTRSKQGPAGVMTGSKRKGGAGVNKDSKRHGPKQVPILMLLQKQSKTHQ